MARYRDIQSDVENIFASDAWIDTGIKAIPSNFNGPVGSDEFVKVEVIPGSPRVFYGTTSANTSGTIGQIIVQIYTESGRGPTRGYEIADTLDTLLQQARLTNGTRTGSSAVAEIGTDQDNESLFRTEYVVNFTHYPS